MSNWKKVNNFMYIRFPGSDWNKYEYYLSRKQLYIYSDVDDLSRFIVVLDNPYMTKLLFLLGAFDD